MRTPVLICLSITLVAMDANAKPRQFPTDIDFSPQGMRMLMAEEGCFVKGGRHVAHGGQILHLGYGHLVVGDESLDVQNGIEEREAEALLWKDVDRAAGAVRSLVHVPLHQHEFDALVMLTFNIGVDGFRDSLVLHHLNAGNRRRAGEGFSVHSRIRSKSGEGNRESSAIRRRREDERYLFLTGHYIQAQPRNEAERHYKSR